MGAIRDLIWKIGGFRFCLKRTQWEYLKFIYFCCQDADRAKASVAEGKHDTPRMERFKCRSKLVLKPSLQQRTLEINMYHHYHVPYLERHLSSDVMHFILERTASTPTEILRELQTSRPPGWKYATADQVYYRWQLANSKIGRRAPDPFCSAPNLLLERPEDQLVSDSEEEIDPPVKNEPDSDDEIAKFISNVEKWVELLKDQQAKGNKKFLRKVMESSGMMVTLVEEVSCLQQQKTMPRTWKHPATKYYKL
jgi:hypothetical protein